MEDKILDNENIENTSEPIEQEEGYIEEPHRQIIVEFPEDNSGDSVEEICEDELPSGLVFEFEDKAEECTTEDEVVNEPEETVAEEELVDEPEYAPAEEVATDEVIESPDSSSDCVENDEDDIDYELVNTKDENEEITVAPVEEAPVESKDTANKKAKKSKKKDKFQFDETPSKSSKKKISLVGVISLIVLLLSIGIPVGLLIYIISAILSFFI